MRILAIAVAIAGLGAGPAHAANYHLLSVTDTGLYLADRDSIQWRGGNPSVVLHSISRTPFARERSYGGYQWIQRSMSRYEVDCNQRRFRSLDYKEFDFSGTQVGSTLSGSDWDPVADGSIAKTVHELVCENKTPGDDDGFSDLNTAIYVYYSRVEDGTIYGANDE